MRQAPSTTAHTLRDRLGKVLMMIAARDEIGHFSLSPLEVPLSNQTMNGSASPGQTLKDDLPKIEIFFFIPDFLPPLTS